MIVTKRKRIVHDQLGNLSKIDILQSVRRKDAPGTLIADPQDKNVNAIMDSTQQKQKYNRKNICLVTLCLLLLAIYLFCSSKLQSEEGQSIKETANLAAFPKKQFTLSQLVKLSQVDGKWNQQIQSRFLSNTKCVAESLGQISCRFNFTKILTNDTLL